MAYRPRTRRRSKRSLSFFRFPRKINKQQVVIYGIAGIIVLTIFGYIGAFGLFAWYGRDLPEPDKLSEARKNSTVFYDRNDEVLYELYQDKNRVPVKQEEIPEVLKQATVAIEDKSFYEHEGVSKSGIMRAFINNYLLGNPQGGSTITQQLIKNVLLSSERAISRKIKEAILAYEVEKKYTKDEILAMYLNEAPYGGTYWGVGTASKGYFDKEPKELSLVESAILAGLPQSPSRYSPFSGEKDAWKVRAKDVLRRMHEDKYITQEEREKAEKQLNQVKFKAARIDATAPHFIFFVKEQIEKEFGPGMLNQGVKVKTTLDKELQQEAEKIVKEEIESLEDYNVGNGALVAIEPDSGEIITYVGSYDYSNEEYGKFDVVTQGNRQPGSTLKPIEYATALKEGYTASSIIMDVKTTFPNQGGEDYIPENYDLSYRGPVQLRFALGNSLNVPAVKMLAMIGINDFLQQAYEMGLRSMEPTTHNVNNLGLSASLGGGETTLFDLTSAFTVFANEGKRVEPESILEITDFDGKSLFKKDRPSPREVLSKEISFIISHILSDNNARISTFGPSSLLVIPGKTVAVKTGTTNDKRDNWTVGYTTDIALGVWVGNNDNSKMNEQIASGVTGASPIWNKVMTELLNKYDDGIMDKPSSVVAKEVDALLGGAPNGGSTRSEYFIEGTEPKEVSSFYKKFDDKEYIVITEVDPISNDGRNRWQEAIDAWAKEQSDSRYHLPEKTSEDSSGEIDVILDSPNNESKVDSNDIQVKAKIYSKVDVKEVIIYVNDEEKKKIEGNNKDINETINLSDGKYEIKVKAINVKDKSSEESAKIGVKVDWK